MNELDLYPLQLSFQVATSATIIGMVLGFPIAFFLARWKHPWVEALDSIITMPMILPPTVLGYYLLVLLGHNSPIGQFFESIGMPLVFTIRGTIIAATLVSIPFFIKAARAAIEGVPQDLIDAARLLGRRDWNIVFSIIIPIAWRGIASGIVLMFARALGDFGTTLMVSGSIPHATMTMPIAIYDALMAGDRNTANILVLIMTGAAFVTLFAINWLNRRLVRREG